MKQSTRAEAWWVFVTAALALIFLAIDLVTPHGMSDGVLYLIVVLVSLKSSRQPQFPVLTVGVCTALVLVGAFLSPRGSPWSVVLFNRGLSLVMLWLVGTIGTLWLRAARGLFECDRCLRQVVQSLREVCWLTDAVENRVLYVSPSYEAVWGAPAQELCDRPTRWIEAIHPEDRGRVESSYGSKAGSGGFNEEYRVVRPDGVVRWVRHRGFPVRDEHGRVYWVAHVVEDTTEARAQQRMQEAQNGVLRLLQLIAVASNEASNFEDALRISLKAVCAFTGWPVGHAYLLDPGPPPVLRTTGVWHLDEPGRFDTFRKITEAARFPRGAGLPGRVLASGRPEWVMDIGKERECPRRGLVEGLNVRTGFAFPVMVGAEVVAVLEFFSTQASPPDQPLLETMANVGTQLGRVIERQRAEEAVRASEKRLRDILDSMFVFVGLFTVDGVLVEANRAPLEAAALKREDVIGKPFAETYWWSYSPAVQEQLREALRRAAMGETVRYDVQVRVAQGRLITIDVTFAPLYDASGKVTQLVGSAVDITERTRAEQARARFEKIVESTTDFVGMCDAGGRVTYVNRAGRRLVGVGEAEDVLPTVWSDYCPAWAARLIEREAKPAAWREGVWSGEAALKTRAGKEIPVILVMVAHKKPDGGVEFFASIARDITRRKIAEEKLRESEERYRSVVTAMSEGVVFQEAGGLIQACNVSAERILGLKGEQIIGRKSLEGVWSLSREDGSPFPAEEHPAMVTLRTGRPCRDVVMGVHKPDGGLAWILVNTQPLFRDGQASPYAVVTSFSDITERRRAEKELRDTQRVFRELSENIREVFWLMDWPNRRMLYVSPAYETIWGRPAERLERVWPEWVGSIHTEDRPRIEGLFREGVVPRGFNEEYRILRPDGQTRWIHDRGFVFWDEVNRASRIAGIAEDVTARKLMEERTRRMTAELEHTSRLTMAGQMAAAVAHELSQPLGAVVNYIGAYLRSPEASGGGGPANLGLLREAQQQALVAGQIVHRMLLFIRRDEPKRTTLDVNEAVRESISLMGPEARFRHVSLREELSDAVPPVLADRIGIQQVMCNLIRNAIEAIDAGGCGSREVVVRTRFQEPGRVVVTVSDTGPGIRPEMRETLFEAFHSDKPQGVGLGLWIIRNIVHAQGGEIYLVRSDRSGTVFEFWLPAGCDSGP